MKKESELLKNNGKLFEFFRKLINAVLDCGGGDENFLRLLKEDKLVRDFASVLMGTHEIVPIEHIIDYSKPPGLPFDEAVELAECIERRKKLGTAKLEKRGPDTYRNGRKIILSLAGMQKQEVRTGGHEVRRVHTTERNNLNANDCDYFLAHPEVAPDEWKEKSERGGIRKIHFWDTIFLDSSDDNLYVCYLYWDANINNFVGGCSNLGGVWYCNDLVASLAS